VNLFLRDSLASQIKGWDFPTGHNCCLESFCETLVQPLRKCQLRLTGAIRAPEHLHFQV
jgi:hypothetical protein